MASRLLSMIQERDFVSPDEKPVLTFFLSLAVTACGLLSQSRTCESFDFHAQTTCCSASDVHDTVSPERQ